MDESLRHQRDTSLGQLEALIRRGRQINDTRAVDATRAWQQDCAAAVNQLSGGSKAHWLARAYSGAFLMRSADGGVVLEADATEIVDRILDVLAQGAMSLARMDDGAASSGAGGAGGTSSGGFGCAKRRSASSRSAAVIACVVVQNSTRIPFGSTV